MNTQHLSVRREDGAYSKRHTQKNNERQRESSTWTTIIFAMGWAVKHETSNHIDTPHV